MEAYGNNIRDRGMRVYDAGQERSERTETGFHLAADIKRLPITTTVTKRSKHIKIGSDMEGNVSCSSGLRNMRSSYKKMQCIAIYAGQNLRKACLNHVICANLREAGLNHAICVTASRALCAIYDNESTYRELRSRADTTEY